MNRRELLQAAGIAAAGLAARQAHAAGPDRPNLLIIQTDEHNFRTLGCYRKLMSPDQALMWGPTVVETPHIDWLAEHGAICTRFYATTPLCSPSRGVFVSGRYPQNTPVTTNNVRLDDKVVTFAEILRRTGYATGYAGKWHLDGEGKPQWAPKRRFGFTDNCYMYNRGHWKQLEDAPDGPRVKARKADKPTYDVAGADAKSFTTDFLADKTVEFIQAHKAEPFCFMVSIPDPHGPDTVRPPYDTMFPTDRLKAPVTMTKPATGLPAWGLMNQAKFQPAAFARYLGMVKCIDDNVGKILTALRRADVLERTIVLFTSDHGDLYGEHGRHNKGVPYEGSARIPFVLYCPGKIAAGTVVKQALSCVDFLPTVLKLMGAPADSAAEGRDASALFTGVPPADWNDVAFLRGACAPGAVPGWLAAVTARYKIVYSPIADPWLYDLQADPNELTNLFTDPAHRETVRRLSGELLAYGRKYKDPAIGNPAIAADLAWAVEGEGPYAPPPRRKPAGPARRPNRRNAPPAEE